MENSQIASVSLPLKVHGMGYWTTVEYLCPWHFSENSGEMKIFQSSVQNAIIQKYLSIPYQKRAGNLPAMKGNQLLPPMCIRGHLVVPPNWSRSSQTATGREDRNKILSILSQHINSNMPQSLKVGSFIIELASQRKSRVKRILLFILLVWKSLMPSCQDQDDMAEKSGSDSDGPLSLKMDDVSPVCRQMPWIQWGRDYMEAKVCSFYTGLSLLQGSLWPINVKKPSSSTSGLIQVRIIFNLDVAPYT